MKDAEICAMLERIRLVEENTFSARFPAERLATVEITLQDGERHVASSTFALGDPENAMTDEAILSKFHRLADALPVERRTIIERSIAVLDANADALRALTGAILFDYAGRPRFRVRGSVL